MRWRRVGRLAATVLLGLAVPVAVGAVGIAGATDELYTARDPNAPSTPRLAGPAWPWTLTLRPVLLAAAAVTAVLGIRLLRRRRSAPAHAAQASDRGADRAAEQTGRRRS
jgi:hypothetical protein